MATGVTKWSTVGKEPKRFEFKPFEAGDYDVVLDTSGATIGKAEREGAVSHVKYKVKVPEVQTASGRPRVVFCRADLGLTPGSDGVVMPDRQNGILGLCKSLGEDAEFSELNDQNGHRLAAKEVKAWLMEHDGASLRAHIKVKPAKDGYEAGNEIAYWMFEEEGAEASEDSDEASDEDEGKSPVEPDEESADDEDEAPKKAAKPAAKPAQKTAAKKKR